MAVVAALGPATMNRSWPASATGDAPKTGAVTIQHETYCLQSHDSPATNSAPAWPTLEDAITVLSGWTVEVSTIILLFKLPAARI